MTIKQAIKQTETLINEAMYLRGTVLGFDGPAFCMDTEITDERLEPFFHNVVTLITEITDDKDYLESYKKHMAPYEWPIGEIQKLLMELKKGLEISDILKIENKKKAK